MSFFAAARRALMLSFTALFILLGSIGLGSEAQAEEIEVDIKTIYASRGEKSMDSKLERLRDELLLAFPQYQRFALLEQAIMKLPLNESRSSVLPDTERSELVITYLGRTEDELLQLQVGLKGKIAADVKASAGSTFFQAGLSYETGILVLAIEPKLAD